MKVAPHFVAENDSENTEIRGQRRNPPHSQQLSQCQHHQRYIATTDAAFVGHIYTFRRQCH